MFYLFLIDEFKKTRPYVFQLQQKKNPYMNIKHKINKARK